MKLEEVPIQSIREALRHQNLAGHSLGGDSISEVYAKVVTTTHSLSSSSSSNADWATISYVQTDSAHGSGGMPDWVAQEAEQLLEALVAAGIVESRAVWFDKLGIKQSKQWPAIATLQCLATPVICIPPTRTIEYSRFQLPDRWDTPSYNFVTKVEDLLRSCSKCRPKMPLEYDSRLLNVAAALRAWPINEATMAASSRGAFISFATLDRIQYTIAWYQVLLHLALDLGQYGSEVHAKSIQLYGQALFQPCPHCVSLARQCTMKDEEQINCQLLDDILASLLQQANKFCLPWARSHEGQYLWSLDGLQSSPGEPFLQGQNNQRRLLRLLRRKALSQSRFDEIAANIVRGRPALSSCYRNGDKWFCALILSNLEKFLNPFQSERKNFDENLRLQVLQLLKLERPFGELSYENSFLDAGGNRSVRSPVCDSQRGSICFFNELSGVLPPHSVGDFIRDRGFSTKERIEILRSSEQSLRRRVHEHGVAFLCYELKNEVVRHNIGGRCASCFKTSPDSNASRRDMLLVGWRAKEAKEAYFRSSVSHSRKNEDKIYSFVTVDVDESCHVLSRGTFSRSKTVTCQNCRSKYVRVEIEDCHDLLEVHVSNGLPIARALTLLYEALNTSHNI